MIFTHFLLNFEHFCPYFFIFFAKILSKTTFSKYYANLFLLKYYANYIILFSDKMTDKQMFSFYKTNLGL